MMYHCAHLISVPPVFDFKFAMEVTLSIPPTRKSVTGSQKVCLNGIAARILGFTSKECAMKSAT